MLNSDYLTDEQLAVAAQLGSSEAFEMLVMRLQAPLIQLLSRRVRSRADAEDLAQDTFVRAYRCLAQYSTRWRFRTWLFTIGQRLAINAARRPRPDANTPLLTLAICDDSDAAEDFALADEKQNLWEIARRELDAEQVSALWLHYVEELPTADIAKILGRTRVSVKTLLFRARKKLLPHVRPADPMEAPAKSSHAGQGRRVANA